MLCVQQHEAESKKLMAKFAAVANEAGSLVHALFFSVNRSSIKMEDRIGLLLNHINLLKDMTVRFLHLMPFLSRSTHTTPTTSTIDSLLILQSLIHDLEDLMSREDNPIADLNDQVQTLHHWFIFLWCGIKHIGSPRVSKIEELEETVRRIGDMANEAEYLTTSFLVGDAPSWYVISRLSEVNCKIEILVADFQEIRNNYKSGNLKAAKNFSMHQSLQAKINTAVDDNTVGFEDRMRDILHLLITSGNDSLQVITIFGMPGLGKTTLAKKLYTYMLNFYWFDKVSWCVVSPTNSRRSLLTDILVQIASHDQLGESKILEMEEESLAEHIHKTLKGRRFLIVMDDIWDSDLWDDMQRYFPDDGNGSRILITTRNKDVAPPNSIIYTLPCLSSDQSWELLEKKVFENKHCPSELIEVGKTVAANCRGLPLAVVVVAGVLSTMEKDKSTWEAVGGNLVSYIFQGGDDSVMQILELSYKHLPDHLKPCFLYFGAFQQGKEIPVQNLMRLWIAEGFVHEEEDRKSVESIAEEYLMKLIDRSLVMVAKRRLDGGVKACVVHDLLHDLCLKISDEENFMKFFKNEIFSSSDGTISSLSYCQHVRSLNCQSYRRRVLSHKGYRMSPPFYIRSMKLLRVLHCTLLHPIEFVGGECLINLRYLVTTHVPKAILGSLINLEYLCIERTAGISLSPAMMNMRKLRWLQLPFEATYSADCDGSQTNRIEFLSGIRISKRKDEEMLKRSPHLRKLKCTCFQYPHLDLTSFTQLESLKVYFNAQRMEDISFSSHIKKLTLFDLRICEEKMSVVGRLENLEVLKLVRSFFAGGRWNSRSGGFQKLRVLKMVISDVAEWNVPCSDHFPRLERVMLSSCRSLQEIPDEIGEIATLEVIEVKAPCPESLLESAQTIQQRQWDMGNQELRIIITR